MAADVVVLVAFQLNLDGYSNARPAALTVSRLWRLSSTLTHPASLISFKALNILMFINRAIPNQALITAASKIILKNWKLSGFRLIEPTRVYSSERTNVIRAAWTFGGRM
jgi:hypothetical protein